MVEFSRMITFAEEVAAIPGGEKIRACIQCGVCTGACPVANEMEYPPRKIIAMIRAGMRDEVLSSDSMWHCLSCYICTVRCPRDVKPTELAHALESLSTHKGYRVRGTNTPFMYRSFVNSVRDNGRVHELGMMLRFYRSITPDLLAKPVSTIKLLLVGLKLLRHRRLPLTPDRVKGRKDLARIIQRFREVRDNQ